MHLSLLEQRHAELEAAYVKACEELTQLRELQAEHVRARAGLENTTYELRERVKELNCLYSVSEIAGRPGISLRAAVQLIAETIPRAWQFPEVACSRIVLHGVTYQSPRFAPLGDSQSQDVVVEGQVIGFVEVRYLEPRPPCHEGPFLGEERSLINAVASRIGEMVEQHHARAAIVASLEKNRALLAAIPDLIVQLDQEGVLFDYRVGDYSEFESSLSRMLGRDFGELFGMPRMFARQKSPNFEFSRDSGGSGTAEVLQRQVILGGTRHDFEIRLVTHPDQNTLGILRDITQRNRLEREILEVSGREQRRIGRELHDGLCQHLAGIAYLAQALSRRVPEAEVALARDASELSELVVEAISLTKGLIRGLIPVRLESEGLKSALLELTSNSGRLFGMDCQVEEPFGEAPTDPTTLLHLYRIAQEALNNAIKHGKASRVTISLKSLAQANVLTIQDNGNGFRVDEASENGLGLGIMRYRAMMIGGTVTIQSAEGRGTSVVCRFSGMTQR